MTTTPSTAPEPGTQVDCPDCNGMGWEPGWMDHTGREHWDGSPCQSCNGTGYAARQSPTVALTNDRDEES